MKTDFNEVPIERMPDNPFKLIGADWMLITAGTAASCNMMTASWGGLGVLWNKKVCFCVIRPQRYTYQFMEKSDTFTLSFFTEDHRRMLNFCGANSGRDVDKAEKTGITPIETAPGFVSFKEARMVIECKKIYFQDLEPENFLDPAIEGNYPKKDYHRMYVGEIQRCLIKGK